MEEKVEKLILHKHSKIKQTSFAGKLVPWVHFFLANGIMAQWLTVADYAVACRQRGKPAFPVLLSVQTSQNQGRLPHIFKPTECILCDWALTCCWNVGGNWRTQRKSTHGENMKNLQETDWGQESNPTVVTPLYYDKQRQAQVLQHDIRPSIID